ncbi:hypothetical protein ACWCTD_03445 [Streptomyces sp. NPDC001499]
MSPTPTNPADLLRKAASLLHDRATAAIHEGRTTWSTGHTLGSKSPVVVDDQEQPSVLIETYATRLERVNAYLALVGPATGLAVAAWLESWTGVDLSEHGPMPEDTQHALTVARKILATSVCPECGTSGACNGGPCPLGTTTGQPATAPWPPTGVERPDHALYTLLRRAGLTPEAAQQEIDTYTQTILARQTAPAVDPTTVLTPAEGQFLAFALDQAAEELSLGAGFTVEAAAALDRLRRLAAEAQQPTPAAAETTDCGCGTYMRCPNGHCSRHYTCQDCGRCCTCECSGAPAPTEETK